MVKRLKLVKLPLEFKCHLGAQTLTAASAVIVPLLFEANTQMLLCRRIVGDLPRLLHTRSFCTIVNDRQVLRRPERIDEWVTAPWVEICICVGGGEIEEFMMRAQQGRKTGDRCPVRHLRPRHMWIEETSGVADSFDECLSRMFGSFIQVVGHPGS